MNLLLLLLLLFVCGFQLVGGSWVIPNHRVLSKTEEIELARVMVNGRKLNQKVQALVGQKKEKEQQQTRRQRQRKIEEEEEYAFYKRNEDAVLFAPGYPNEDEFVRYVPYNNNNNNNNNNDHHHHHHVLPPPPPPPLLAYLTNEEIKDAFGLERKEVWLGLKRGREARQTLVLCNLRLVANIARKWHGTEDMMQEGILGLMDAMDAYDPSRNLRFSTLGTVCITNRMRLCKRNSAIVRIPADLYHIAQQHRRIMRSSSSKRPNQAEMARRIGVTVQRLQQALRYTRPNLSLDTLDTDNTPKSDGICLVDRILLRQCLETAMASELSPYERDVIRLRLGLDDGIARTAKQVVDACGGGISIYDVRNTERRAYQKLGETEYLRHVQAITK